MSKDSIRFEAIQSADGSLIIVRDHQDGSMREIVAEEYLDGLYAPIYDRKGSNETEYHDNGKRFYNQKCMWAPVDNYADITRSINEGRWAGKSYAEAYKDAIAKHKAPEPIARNREEFKGDLVDHSIFKNMPTNKDKRPLMSEMVAAEITSLGHDDDFCY